MTHTDGGVKCAVQVGRVTNREIMVCQGEMGKIERNLEIMFVNYGEMGENMVFVNQGGKLCF